MSPAWTWIPADGLNPVQFVVLGGLATMLMSVAKAGFGGSIGILAVPMMIYACGGDSQLAVGIMLPLLIACDYISIVPWMGKWNWRAVWLLLPGALVGVGVGWAMLWGFRQLGAGGDSDRIAGGALKLSIAIIALGFVALQAWRSMSKRPVAFRPVLWQGTCVGTVAGVTSTLAHAAGPIVSMYMLPQNMPKDRFVASTVLYYWIGNQLKLVPYLALGLISADSVGPSLLLVPAAAVGAVLGVILHRLVGQRSFTGIVYTLLALAGLHMGYGAIVALWD